MAEIKMKPPQILLFIIIVTLLISGVMGLATLKPASGARFLLQCFLCWFLYQGKNWARYWLIVIYFLGAAYALFFLANGFALHKPMPIGLVAIFVVLGAFYFFAFWVLGFSKAVLEYFENKKIKAT